MEEGEEGSSTGVGFEVRCKKLMDIVEFLTWFRNASKIEASDKQQTPSVITMIPKIGNKLFSKFD